MAQRSAGIEDPSHRIRTQDLWVITHNLGPEPSKKQWDIAQVQEIEQASDI